MMKARSGTTLIFGLSKRNLELLQDGRPIRIDLRELGAAEGNVLIFYGETEEIMEMRLREAGVRFPEDGAGA